MTVQFSVQPLHDQLQTVFSEAFNTGAGLSRAYHRWAVTHHPDKLLNRSIDERREAGHHFAYVVELIETVRRHKGWG